MDYRGKNYRSTGINEFIESHIVKNPKWKIQFIATICPQCGWNLEGENDSVVLTCGNCDTAWEATNGKFEQIRVAHVPIDDNNCIYLPFWKNSTGTKGVGIDSFGDFIRITNQPIVAIEDWENETVKYVCRGEKNLTFVCSEKLGAYLNTAYRLGDLLGWKRDYDEKSDKIVDLWK